jgi:hypothetical protein
MFTDFINALRYAINEFKRDWKRRAWLRNHRASTFDPFSN